MRRASCCQPFWVRCLVAILVPVLALALTEFLAGGSPAQGAPPKKRPKQKPPEEEIEDPGAAKKPTKPPLRVPESTKPAAKGTGKNTSETVDQSDSGLTILARAAKTAPDRDQRELFASLAHPYDRIANGLIQFPIVPVATYLGDPPSFEGQMMIRRYTDGKVGKAMPYSERDIKGYQPYEDIAIDAVDEYLKRMQTRSGAAPTLKELKAAGTVLDAVLRWHLSAVQRSARLGDGWQRFERNLRDKLLDILLQQLKILVDSKQWDSAYGLTIRLADDYPKDKRVEAATLRFLAAQAHDSVEKAGASNSNDDWRKVARAFRDLQQRFPDSAAVGEIRPELENKARSLKASAEKELK
ncbi:MAG TPA: hypothetical protein VFA18_12575, partial [Gemmataceae bacterium]|nr:hypothetical protein [Gemmataceae bacterium]